MKRLFLLLALVGMIATSCEDSGIEEPSNPTEQPDDNTNEEQPGGDDNTDEEQPGGDDNTDEEQPGDDENTDEEQPGDDENEDNDELPVFEIDGPGEYTIGAEGGSIEVIVATNLGYRLEVSEDAQSWLTIADTRAVRIERLTISVSPNNTDSERTATISVFDGADNKVFSFTLTQEYVNPDEIIKFVDNTTKTICLAIWDTNGDAELSIGEAIAVTDIGTIFQGKDIMSFDEFKYFTGVTSIETGAFMDCANLVKISIPDSVTTIGMWAFYKCSSLTSVTIGDSVTTIEYEAFADCDSLTEFNGKFASEDGRCLIVDGVLTLFAPYGLTAYTIPDSVTTIGDDAFAGCDSLTSVTIPDGVTTIGDYTFYKCTNLTSVTIPDSVTSIGNHAFYNCYNLTSVTIPDSVTTIGDYTFYECSSLTSVTIGDGVTTIGIWAFYKCSSLTSITIPDSVTEIGDSAFSGCTGKLIINSKIVETDYDYYNFPSTHGWLKGYYFLSLTIGNGVTLIGRYAFKNCSTLTSVTIGDGVTTIGNGAFYGCDMLTSITIPNSVTTIGGSAFGYCIRLRSVTIPDSVTTIGDSAFYECDSLTSITIPDSITTIGEYAFKNCDRLTSVTIPDSVTTIGEKAFYECYSLTSVTIPESVTTIGLAAFEYCRSLTSVFCKATTPPALGGYAVFDYNPSGRKIYVPTESVDAYKSASRWSSYASAIVGYDF